MIHKKFFHLTVISFLYCNATNPMICKTPEAIRAEAQKILRKEVAFVDPITGETNLMYAASYPGEYNRKRLIEYLTKGKMNPNTTDDNQKTALMHIFELRKTTSTPCETIVWLCGSGANANRRDNGGQTALIKLLHKVKHEKDRARSKNETIEQSLITQYKWPLRLLLYYMDRSAVNAPDIYGKTALDYAIATQIPQIIRIMLKRGASLTPSLTNKIPSLTTPPSNKEIEAMIEKQSYLQKHNDNLKAFLFMLAYLSHLTTLSKSNHCSLL